MNKQVFEGKINGESFTDVKEFNKKVAEMMEAGQNYNISYNWSSKNVEEPDECKCGGKCDCHKLSPEELGYIIPRYSYGSVTTSNETEMDKLFDKVVNDLDSRFDEFIDASKCDCTRKALEGRLVEAKKSTMMEEKRLDEVCASIEARENELMKELQAIQEKKDIINTERLILEEVKSYYKSIEDELNKYQSGSDEKIAKIEETLPQQEQVFEIKDALNMLGVDTTKISDEDMTKLQKITDNLAEQLTKYIGQCF